MSSLGAGSGGPAAIPAGDHRIPAGEGWESELGTLGARFEAWLAANGRPAGVPHGRAVRCPPGAAAPARGAAQGRLRAAG
jgi:hypothetical protein